MPGKQNSARRGNALSIAGADGARFFGEIIRQPMERSYGPHTECFHVGSALACPDWAINGFLSVTRQHAIESDGSRFTSGFYV
jgi:hypothetical protein